MTESTTQLVRALTDKFLLEPMSQETGEVLRPIRLMPNDRLEVALDDEGTSFVVQAYAERHDGSRGAASEPASYGWFQRVPERKNIGYGRWLLKATDVSALILNATWPAEKVVFTEEAKIQFEYLLHRFFQQTVGAQHRARFKESGVIPPTPDGFIDHPVRPLTAYQLCAHHTTIGVEGAAFFMQQGTGKTPVAIRRICTEAARVYKREGRMHRSIVVAPRNVRGNWAKEIARFTMLPGKVVVLRGGQLHRVKQLVDAMTPDEDSQFVVVICSYETLQRSWHALRMIEWDLAIADESHYFKSPWAKRTKFMMQLRDRAAKRLILTGTPIANNILDLFYQLEFLGEGMSGFSNWKAFREYYTRFAKHEAGDGHRIEIGFKNLPILQERLARVAFMITKKEAMPELPDKTYDIIEASMTKAQRDLYSKVAKELAAEIESDLLRAEKSGINPKITTNNILTKLLRLAQITAGIVVADKEYNDEGELLNPDRTHFIDNNPKMEELIGILKEKGPQEKTIVWSCFVPVIREIAERCKEEGIECVTYYGGTSEAERAEIERRWNEDPNLKVFVGNPAAGGVGLNLPGYVPEWEGTDKDHGCNADHTIYFACDWSMLKRSQSEDRNHGKGRCRVPIRVSDLVIPGTIDEEIRARVLQKQATALAVQDIRAILVRLADTSILNGD